MVLEAEPVKAKPDVREHNIGHETADRPADLASSMWESMKLASLAKGSQPASAMPAFDSPYPDLKTAQFNAKSELAVPGQVQPSAARPETTKTHKNPDGGHTDTTNGAAGSEVSTYDQNGKLVFKRSENRDGTYSEWKVDRTGHVAIHEKKSDGSLRTRDEYPNGNFREETKYKDGKKSSSSHFADSDGGYVDDTVRRDGSENLSKFDSSGKVVFHYVRNSDGSSTQRKINPDGSETFRDKKVDGSYTESKTDQSGTSKTVHTVNKADGSSETKNYDSSGQLTSERQTKRDQSYKETTYNLADGTKTVHEQDKKGAYAEQFLNSKGERVSPTITVAPQASPEFVQRVKDELANLPEPVRKLLAQNNAVIGITGKMSDVDPAEAKRRPRGYEKGETGDDSSGVQLQIVGKDGKKIELAIIAEKTRSGASEDVEGTIRHEVGHIVDALLKQYSHSSQFKAAYDGDIAALSKDTKLDEKYFLQKGHKGRDGREEAFAEVLRAVTGDPREKRNAEVLKLFPKMAELVKKRLSELPQ